MKLQVLQLNSLQIENDLLKQENVDCKGKILQLEEDNKALKKVNDELSIENRIFTEKLRSVFPASTTKTERRKPKSKAKQRKESTALLTLQQARLTLDKAPQQAHCGFVCYFFSLLAFM